MMMSYFTAQAPSRRVFFNVAVICNYKNRGVIHLVKDANQIVANRNEKRFRGEMRIRCEIEVGFVMAFFVRLLSKKIATELFAELIEHEINKQALA